MATFPRKLRISKREAYQLDVSEWLAGESVSSLTVDTDSSFLTVEATQIDGSLLKCICQGVSVGNAELHFQFTTATRSNCDKATVKVIDDC